MPDNPNPQGPEQQMAGNGQDNSQGSAEGAHAETESVLDAVRAEFQGLKSEFKQSLDQQRSYHDRQMNQVRYQLQQAQATSQGTGEPVYGEEDNSAMRPQMPVGPDPNVERLNRLEIQSAMSGYDSRYHEQIRAIIDDPVKAADVAVWNPRTQSVDFERSVRNAYREVRLSEMEQMDAKSGAAREQAEAKRQQDLKLAHISGGGSGGEEETVIDTSTMTSDEMLAKGLVQDMDPDDPIRPKRPVRR